MNKIFSFIAILFLATTLWAGNTITYTATEKLEVCNLLEGMESFGPAIISHTFSDNTGTIVCDGEITMIGDTVFDECPNLISVNIPNSVKEIGFGAFRYSGLTDVYVNWIKINDLPALEDEVFTEIADGVGLRGATLHVPEGTDCVYFDAEVWQDFGMIDAPEPKHDTSYVTITLASLPYIYMWTPYHDKTIECFVETEGLTVYYETIKSVAGCDSVMYSLELSAVLPKDNMIITYTATEKLPGYNGSLDIGATTFGSAIISHEFSDGAGTIVCDGEITMIGDWTFYGCSGLTSIEIPNSVKTIGGQAFYDCSGLPSISIPDSVKTIGDHAFDGCSGLTSIEIPNPVSTIGEYVFRYCDNLTSVTLPNSLVTIGDDAFCFCSRLISITIPYSVTTIGSCIFSNCYSLNSINVDAANTHYSAVDGVLFNYTKDTLIQYPTGNIQAEYEIPNSVTTIGEWAFGNCMHLALVTIPLSVTTIEDFAFAGCSGLYKITIPSSVTTIGEWALFCVNLQTIFCEAVIPPETNNAFYGCDYSIPLYVPAGSKEAYQTASEWRKFTNIYDIISSVDSVTTTTAVIKWQKVDSAVSYTLSVIETESADTVARYEIDSTGTIIKELRSLPHNVPQMVLDTTVSSAEIFEVSLTNLSSGTTYTYAIDAKDSEATIINSSAGTFTTKSETAINTIKEKKTFYYRPINILGQPIDPKTHQGIYIQNGKKYLNIW